MRLSSGPPTRRAAYQRAATSTLGLTNAVGRMGAAPAIAVATGIGTAGASGLASNTEGSAGIGCAPGAAGAGAGAAATCVNGFARAGTTTISRPAKASASGRLTAPSDGALWRTNAANDGC